MQSIIQFISNHPAMANSKYEYVKAFERENYLLPETYIVVRIDGRGFHRLSDIYEFQKPNDIRALELMNDAAAAVMNILPDIVLSYGDSDEYSFVLRRSCQLFERREAKLVSTIVSSFTAFYHQFWSARFPNTELSPERLPTFDGRAVIYPSTKTLRDYLSWRQVDCHINNLYNTTFWNLVIKGGMTNTAAEERLRGTVSSDKNEILFSEFGINYNNEPEIFKKGTIIYRDLGQGSISTDDTHLSSRQQERIKKKLAHANLHKEHVDIIADKFWQDHPQLLEQ